MGNDKNEKRKPNSGAPTRLLRRNQENNPANTFDWGNVPPDRLGDLIGLVTGRGGAIRFGYSRDGNAGSVGIYYGDSRDTVYLRPSDDWEETFGLIEEFFNSKPYSAGKSPA